MWLEWCFFMGFLLGCQISTFQIEDSVTILQSGLTLQESYNTILSERVNYINIHLNFPSPVLQFDGTDKWNDTVYIKRAYLNNSAVISKNITSQFARKMLGKISAASIREYLHNADFFRPHRSSRLFFCVAGILKSQRVDGWSNTCMKSTTTKAKGQLHGELAKSNQLILGNQNYIAELSHLMCIDQKKRIRTGI